jgi:hypothetical protein
LGDVVAAALFLGGCGLAAHFRSVNTAPGETGLAALTLLHKGFIGDPYSLPTGPTAHVSPVLAAYLAGIYQVFGGNTASARTALGIGGAAALALSARAAIGICGLPGKPAGARWAAAAILVLMSGMLLFDAAVTLRQWDQPFAALVLVLGWQVLERTRIGLMPLVQAGAWAGLLAGIGCLLSPAIFPGLLASLALIAWTGGRQGGVKAGLLGAAIAAAIVLPWGLRNEAVLGRFIVTRSNFPLEMAVGNAPGADGTSESGIGRALHPHQSPAAASEMARIGELAYMAEMGAKARGWIAGDPARFARLVIERMRLSFLPSRAMIDWYPWIGVRLPRLYADAFGLAVLVSLSAVLALRWRRPAELLLPAVFFTVLPLAPYFLTHVNIRYLYVTRPVDVVLIVLALLPVWTQWQAHAESSARPLPQTRPARTFPPAYPRIGPVISSGRTHASKSASLTNPSASAAAFKLPPSRCAFSAICADFS